MFDVIDAIEIKENLIVVAWSWEERFLGKFDSCWIFEFIFIFMLKKIIWESFINKVQFWNNTNYSGFNLFALATAF